MDLPSFIQNLTDPSVFLKIIEFFMSLVAMSVEQGGVAEFGSASREFIGGGTLMLSLVVTTLLFVSYINGQQRHLQKAYFEAAFDGVLVVLMVVAGTLIIETYAGQIGTVAQHGNTVGAFCILNSIVYATDCYYAVVNYRSAVEQL